MHLSGSIRTVNLRIRDFVSSNTSESRTASLVINKMAAKFEEPRSDADSSRRNDAWDRWIAFDESLAPEGLLGPGWAKARLLIHEYLRDFRVGDLTFTNGSSFEPLGSRTSIACKLTSSWTITADCFDLFAKYSFWHRALKHAVKKRFKCYCTERQWDVRAVNRMLWKRYKTKDVPAFQIYAFKLFCVVTFVHGNRYSTVPKNNLKDRSICLEPLCNMLVQRAVGLGIRRCLKRHVGIDLDHLADVHRSRISDPKVATIDLSDCSDAISLKLVRYLFPSRVLGLILASRSDMTLGPDDNFYVVNKVSSMGNGFTFDLMSLILTALTRVYDATSTVFGDDIICQNQVAPDVIADLIRAGFVVNQKKTNVNSTYRESCGANYIDEVGYVTTFDFRWIKTPHDLVVACNKVAILAANYGEPFETLRSEIWSYVPSTLLGAAVPRHAVHTGRPPIYELDTYVRHGPLVQCDPSPHKLRSLRAFGKALQKGGRFSVALSFASSLSTASSSLKSDDWDLYFQYIHSCRKSRRVPRLVSKSTLVARVNEEQIGFVYALLPVRDKVVGSSDSACAVQAPAV